MTKATVTGLVESHERAFNAALERGLTEVAVEQLVNVHCLVVLASIFDNLSDEALEIESRMIDAAGLTYVEVSDLVQGRAKA